jgi:tripartite-type tricarboxylate transporter receptor subunit TctC
MPLLAPPGTFDARKFTWLGSMSGDTSLCLTGGKSAVKTWQDMLTKPLIMGGQAVGTDSDIYARLYKNVLGAKMRIVSGYPGTAEIRLAMERGEVDGICGLSWGTVKVSNPEWRKNKTVNFLLQAGLRMNPDLPDVPFAMDLVKEPEKKQIFYLHFAPQAMGRPFAAPPDIPADRKAALLTAFDRTMKDPELLAEAAKSGMDIDPISGAQIHQLLTQIYSTPPDVVAKAAKAVAE